MNDFSDFSMGNDFSMGGFDTAVAVHPDKCTQCSICVNTCPTYQISNDFKQSPMGRIKILRQKEEQTTTEDLAALESCLHCFNCESMCPSQVAYRELIVDGFERLKLPRENSFPVQALHQYVESSRLKKFLNTLAKCAAPIIEVVNPLRHTAYSAVLRRINKSTRTNSKPNKITLTPDSKTVLFTGCMGALLDGRTINDAENILKTINPDISIEENSCCGALHRHSGKKSQSVDIATANARRYLEAETTQIITISSACGDSLSHYPQWVENEQREIENIDALADAQTDIIDYLQQENWQPEKIDSLPFQKVLVHVPCSSSIASKTNLVDFLARIDGLEFDLLSSPYSCCGAGGTHLVTHPDMAQKALEPMLQDIRDRQPDLIISSNIGCSIHLESGLRQNKITIPVLHPISFLHYFSPPAF